jgi:glycosyltransferase involved in cell wall biosynthesis
MKITIVQGGALPIPPVRGGAVEKVWFSLGREFAKRGHEVTHISRAFSEFPSEQWLDGVHHVRIKGVEFSSKRYVLVWRDLGYVRRVLRVLPQADILVTNSPLLPLFIRNQQFGALYVHVARYPKGQMRFYRHASRIQTVSRPVAEAIVRQDPESAGKVRVIPYPLPSTVLTLDVAASWQDRSTEILYVGRVHPEKGVHVLIDAFRLLVQSGVEDWRLVVVGPWAAAQGGGGEGYYESLRAKSAVIANWVNLAGPIFDQDVLATHYRRARLFVYPSLAERGEAFGLAPLEAMAQGCPPLVSTLACFQDFIEDGRSGFIFEHRSERPAEELYGSLKRIVRVDQELMSVAVRSHEVARAYDPSNVAGMYLEDFATIAASRRVPHSQVV